MHQSYTFLMFPTCFFLFQLCRSARYQFVSLHVRPCRHQSAGRQVILVHSVRAV